MRCDICGKEFTQITLNQFNVIVFGVLVGDGVIPKANAKVCNECCNKVIKFIDGISKDTGIVLP